ncbi:MAG: hypothetical protein EA350_11530 [Gemmatimonadales bacterium]|nr:MAG: hypothetical protein EA350_11530 [Gemmatimonadales bacterium]
MGSMGSMGSMGRGGGLEHASSGAASNFGGGEGAGQEGKRRCPARDPALDWHLADRAPCPLARPPAPPVTCHRRLPAIAGHRPSAPRPPNPPGSAMTRPQGVWLATPARFLAGSFLAALLLVPMGVGERPVVRAEGPDLVVLVRHAEKADEPASDPPLSPEGTARALELSRVLADAGITRIHSTDTRRTRETAAPLADALGIEVELYDSRDLPAMATRLGSLPGRHLVVGHSNTTDALAGALGGETFGEIVEAWEYDRLYFLAPRGEGVGFGTVLVRFGAHATPR